MRLEVSGGLVEFWKMPCLGRREHMNYLGEEFAWESREGRVESAWGDWE